VCTPPQFIGGLVVHEFHASVRIHLGGEGFTRREAAHVGVLWALWHVGLYQNGVLYMAFFVLLMISYTFVIYALVVDTGFNVLMAAIFHLMINITNLFSFSIINDVGFIMVNSLVWAAIAVVVVLTRRSLFVARKTTQ
jgi:hypothetical protein